jgi:hypothetical protein
MVFIQGRKQTPKMQDGKRAIKSFEEERRKNYEKDGSLS